MMTGRAWALGAPLLAAGLLLSGCDGAERDVAAELAKLTENVAGRIEPLPAVKGYTPYEYAVADRVDPFGPEKMQLATRVSTTAAKSPDVARPKEVLEAYPLEALRYAGTITVNGAVNALIAVDGNLYTVKLGNYVGQSYGRIVKITESEVLLRELVQDGSGEWIERTASLALPTN